MEKKNWIFLGVAYKLNEEYSKSYNLAHFFISTDGKEIKVELQSNWNSSYNQTDILKVARFGSPFDTIHEYTN